MATTISRQELLWPNVAKAGCILLVVMMHLADQITRMPWADQAQLATAWHVVNGFIRPVRMPLFFLVSGLLASDSILQARPDAQRLRLVRPLYLYFAWALIYQVLVPMNPEGGWLDLSRDNRILPAAMMVMMSWYLAALAMYYLLTRITLPLPTGAALLACAVLSVMGTVFTEHLTGHEPKMLRCAIFFVAGVRMKDAILTFVERATAMRVVLLGAGYLAGAAVALRSDTFLLPVDMLAAASGAMLCALLVRHKSALVAPASWLAKRTLPIYLIHFLMIPILMALIETWAAPALGSLWIGAIYPVASVPLVVAASLGVHAALGRLRLSGWLFDLPPHLLQPVTRRRAAQAQNPVAGALTPLAA